MVKKRSKVVKIGQKAAKEAHRTQRAMSGQAAVKTRSSSGQTAVKQRPHEAVKQRSNSSQMKWSNIEVGPPSPRPRPAPGNGEWSNVLVKYGYIYKMVKYGHIYDGQIWSYIWSNTVQIRSRCPLGSNIQKWLKKQSSKDSDQLRAVSQAVRSSG